VLGLFSRRKPEPEAAPEPDIDLLANEVMEKHQDWRKGLLRYVLREQKRHSKPLETDK